MDKNVPVFDCTKKVDTLIDINNDQKYEIITSCMYFDRIGTCHDLYQLKKGKYEKIYKCDDPKSGMWYNGKRISKEELICLNLNLERNQKTY